jgi:hypothetical protein
MSQNRWQVKATVAAQGRGRSIVNVSIIRNTNVFGTTVSRAYAAKAEVHLGHADSIAKWYRSVPKGS